MRWLAAAVALASGCSLLYDGHNLRGHRSDASYVCSVTPKHTINFVEGGATALGKTGVLAAGYFDGDGFVDVALASDSSNELLVFAGNGDSSFRMLASLATGAGPADVAAFDVDRDGHVDLVVANAMSGNLTLWFGAGDGSFGDRRDVQIGTMASNLVTADFDGNGWIDLALGNGDGSVEVVPHTTRGRDAYVQSSARVANVFDGTLAAGDLDGDGHVDLAASGGFHSSDVAVLLNRGGTFSVAPPVMLPTQGTNDGLATADLDGDGRADLAVPLRTNSGSNDIYTFRAAGGGAFGAATKTTLLDGNGVAETHVCDFDGDGHADLAVTNLYTPQMDVLLGRGDGSFGDPITTPQTGTDHTSGTAIADIDGDGIADVLMLGVDGTLASWLNRAN